MFKRICIESQNTLLTCTNTRKCETEALAAHNVYEAKDDESKVLVKEEGFSDHFDEGKITLLYLYKN